MLNAAGPCPYICKNPERLEQAWQCRSDPIPDAKCTSLLPWLSWSQCPLAESTFAVAVGPSFCCLL